MPAPVKVPSSQSNAPAAPSALDQANGETNAATRMKPALRGASYNEGAAMVAPGASKGGAAPAPQSRKDDAKAWMRLTCGSQIDAGRRGLQESLKSRCEGAAGQLASTPVDGIVPLEISARDQFVGEASLPSEVASYLIMQPGDKALFSSFVCGSSPVSVQVLASRDTSGGKMLMLRGYCNVNHQLMSTSGTLKLEDHATFNITLNCGRGSQGGLVGGVQALLEDPSAQAMVLPAWKALD